MKTVFYEDDEPVDRVRAAFECGEPQVTVQPTESVAWIQPGAVSTTTTGVVCPLVWRPVTGAN